MGGIQEQDRYTTSGIRAQDRCTTSGIRTQDRCTLRMLAHNTPTISALRTLLPQFTRSTGIQVDIITTSLSELLNKAASRDDRWDIIRVDPSSLSHMAPGILLPLEEADRDADRHFRHLLDPSRRTIPGLTGPYTPTPLMSACSCSSTENPCLKAWHSSAPFMKNPAASLRSPPPTGSWKPWPGSLPGHAGVIPLRHTVPVSLPIPARPP